MEPQPVIDGNRHIAQGCEILAPSLLSGFRLVADEKGPAVHQQEQGPLGFGIVPDRRVDVHFQRDRFRNAAVEQEFEGGFLVADGRMGIIPHGGPVGDVRVHLHFISGCRKRKCHGEENRQQTHDQKVSASRRPKRVAASIFSSSSSGVL